MSKPQWTEGEWTVQKTLSDSAFVIHGPDTRAYDDTVAVVHGRANAHLIAAASEMYRELESLLIYADPFYLNPPSRLRVQQIKSLLARARGETE